MIITQEIQKSLTIVIGTIISVGIISLALVELSLISVNLNFDLSPKQYATTNLSINCQTNVSQITNNVYIQECKIKNENATVEFYFYRVGTGIADQVRVFGILPDNKTGFDAEIPPFVNKTVGMCLKGDTVCSALPEYKYDLPENR